LKDRLSVQKRLEGGAKYSHPQTMAHAVGTERQCAPDLIFRPAYC
jgi:hypothetical protein